MAVNAQQQGAKGLKMNDLAVVEKIAQWQKLKALVLDSVSSPITKRVYNMALEEFLQLVPAGAATGLHQGKP